MKLDKRIAELVAVGASVSANCLPCVEINVARAVDDGVDPGEIAGAIEIGKLVRKGAASKMDRHVTELLGKTSEAERPGEGCLCNA